MKNFLLILALALPGFVFAQGASSVASQKAASAFAVQPPDEGSPFFAVRDAARYELSQQSLQQQRQDTVAIYPRARGSEETVPVIFKKFFTEMFSSINLKVMRGEATSQKLEIEPSEFSLAERREVDVNYTIRNNTRKIMRIDYPSSQRIEIITTDPQGKVVDRWSDDRSFENRDGVVYINPKERVEYSEKLPTRELKAGEIYSVQSTVPNNPEFTQTRQITPQR